MTILRGSDQRGVQSLDVDVAICGAGAGGSMAASVLARAGLRVALLEEGTDHTPDTFTHREEEMIPRLYQEHGGRRTEDLAILVLSGRGLGGSTIHNTNLCKRAAPEILEEWAAEHDLASWSAANLRASYEEVERLLSVVPIVDEQISSNNRTFLRGVEKLGYAHATLSHNRRGCVGSGFCELGCVYDAKLNARKVLIPDAVAHGAQVYSETRAERIVFEAEHVTGVECAFLSRTRQNQGTLRVRARAVCLAGSAIGSATLALASGVTDPHHQVGQHLHLHPGAVVAGVFPERIEAWKGIPQSIECTEFLSFAKGSRRRAWLVPSFAHPIGTASLMPGFGPSFMKQMRSYSHLAAVAVMVHDETEGQVSVSGGRTRIAYAPSPADREQLALGARGAAKILLAAGATSVVVPATPEIRIRTERDTELLTAERFKPHDAKLTAVHPMGTLRLGSDPRSSVVDERGEHHHVKGLYVADGSLFPTSLGGPPQLSIYAAAHKVARAIVEQLRATATV